MISHFKSVTLCCAFAILFSIIGIAQTKQALAPPAPIPEQILAAKKIFIANAGGDEMAENDPIFTGGPARAYNQFYDAMKTWGRFAIVSSPAEADMLLEIRQDVSAVTPTGRSAASSSYIPQFSLKIRDPKSNALLWGFNIHTTFGIGQSASDANFDQAVDRLVTDLRVLVAQSAPPAASENKP
jgi:hypothetical protein